MKEIDTSQTPYFSEFKVPAVNLSRDDLLSFSASNAEITGNFSASCNSKKNKKLVFEDLSDLKNNIDLLKVPFTLNFGTFTVLFSRREGIIVRSKYEDRLDAERAHTQLLHFKPWYSPLSNTSLYIASVSLILLDAFAPQSWQELFRSLVPAPDLSLSKSWSTLIWVAVIVLAANARFIFFATILDNSPHKGFFSRNKDQIILAFIAAIFASLTAFGTERAFNENDNKVEDQSEADT